MKISSLSRWQLATVSLNPRPERWTLYAHRWNITPLPPLFPPPPPKRAANCLFPLCFTTNIAAGVFSPSPPPPLPQNKQPIVYFLSVLPLMLYHRSGFNCEYPIIANCEFISSSQKLERKKKMYTCTQSIVRYEANQQATNAERSRAA